MARASSSAPVPPGMRWSVRITETSLASSIASASSAEFAVRTR